MSAEQAHAFQSKFWGMHIDSARAVVFKKSSGKSTPTPNGGDAETANEGVKAINGYMDKLSQGLRSADPDPERSSEPFKSRLRPGMVVSWSPPEGLRGVPHLPGRNLAILLAPTEKEGEYTCGMVAPAVLPGAFEVFVWHQFPAAVDLMIAEVILEYDVGSRYYYETV